MEDSSPVNAVALFQLFNDYNLIHIKVAEDRGKRQNLSKTADATIVVVLKGKADWE